jgi:hypothetical protein
VQGQRCRHPGARYALALLLRGQGRDAEAAQAYRDADAAGQLMALAELADWLREQGRDAEAEHTRARTPEGTAVEVSPGVHLNCSPVLARQLRRLRRRPFRQKTVASCPRSPGRAV